MSVEIVPIIKVGAIGEPRVNDGRLIPFITVDCSNHPSLEQLIELHNDIELPGDVISTWGWKRFNKSNIFLKLEFKRPMEVKAFLVFPIAKHSNTIEWILNMKAFYLQSSKYGDSASKGYGKPTVLVEVPADTTFPIWNNLYDKYLKKMFRRDGFSKKDSKKMAEEYKTRLRETWYRRPGAITNLVPLK